MPVKGVPGNTMYIDNNTLLTTDTYLFGKLTQYLYNNDKNNSKLKYKKTISQTCEC